MSKISFVSSLLITSLVFSITIPLTEDPQNQSQPSEKEFYQKPVHLSIRVDEGRGVGYTKGYATGELYVFPSISETLFPFIDLRFHQFFDNKIAFNAGSGFRMVSEPLCTAFGLNVYYDFRNMHGSYNQVGMGLEVIHRVWALRLNGYLPVGNKMGSICSSEQVSGDFFIKKRSFEVALKGANLELDILLTRLESISVNLCGGPYFFEGSTCRNVIGGQVGLRGNFWNWINLAINQTYDGVYGLRLQGEFGLVISLGKSSKKLKPESSCFSLQEIAKKPVWRNEIIVLDKKCNWEWNY